MVMDGLRCMRSSANKHGSVRKPIPFLYFHLQVFVGFQPNPTQVPNPLLYRREKEKGARGRRRKQHPRTVVRQQRANSDSRAKKQHGKGNNRSAAQPRQEIGVSLSHAETAATVLRTHTIPFGCSDSHLRLRLRLRQPFKSHAVGWLQLILFFIACSFN